MIEKSQQLVDYIKKITLNKRSRRTRGFTTFYEKKYQTEILRFARDV